MTNQEIIAAWKSIKVLEIDGKVYGIDNRYWNGEYYHHCWQIFEDEDGYIETSKENYKITPQYGGNKTNYYPIVGYLVEAK